MVLSWLQIVLKWFEGVRYVWSPQFRTEQHVFDRVVLDDSARTNLGASELESRLDGPIRGLLLDDQA